MIEKEIKERLAPAWRFEGYYIDCEAGEVYSVRQSKLKKLKPALTKKGYLSLEFKINNVRNLIRLHRLVWSSYHKKDIPEGYEIDHKNGVKNDNRISNLQLLTHNENIQKACNKPIYLNSVKSGGKYYFNSMTEASKYFRFKSVTHLHTLIWRAIKKGTNIINLKGESFRFSQRELIFINIERFIL